LTGVPPIFVPFPKREAKVTPAGHIEMSPVGRFLFLLLLGTTAFLKIFIQHQPVIFTLLVYEENKILL
jgi:hypothetical protein